MTAAVVVPIRARQRQQFVANLYSTSEADRWIDRHNEALREKLQLSEEDAAQIDLDG